MNPFKVLIVDDEEALASLLSKGLSEDFASLSVFSARETLALISGEPLENIPLGGKLLFDWVIEKKKSMFQIPYIPDLLVTDIQMPEINGFCLISLLKEWIPGLKVILMTGNGQEEIDKSELDSHIRGFLMKPFRIKELVDLSKRVLS